ncbi:hypothetical protein IH575_00320 [Candidatus Dojkabacteria bacterium]|nr:hypothetical protein [Candidatus Dojkabacteria bacterium]
MYKINQVPDITDISYASIDLEMFGQDKDRLHQPHGTFACLSVVLGNFAQSISRSYLISDVTMLQQTMDTLQGVPIWVFQNATYDIIQLGGLCDVQPDGLPLHYIWDTMLVEKILYSGYYVNFSLKDLARRYLGKLLAKDKYEDIADRTIDTKALYDYAIDDALDTRDVFLKQHPLLYTSPALKRIYDEVDAPMVWVVANLQPVRIDVSRWLEFAKINKAKADSIELEIGVNTMSPKQVKERLLTLGINVESTGDEILAEYAGNHFVDKVREARMYRTAVSKYGDKWIEKHVVNGLVKAGFNVTGALTGRMSSDNPNLQNIPSRKMPVFREFFITNMGTMIVADVSQQEPRITALLSNDPTLVSVFNNKEDIHSTITKLIFGLDEVDKHDPRRKIGKEIGLGMAYGLSAEGLRSNLKEKAPELFENGKDLTVSECQAFIDKYFKKFPAVKTALDQIVKNGFKNEYVSSPAGRKIHINIHANGWERGCMNYPHQSGGVDMLKVWCRFILDETRARGIPFGMSMLIHDEVVMDVKTELLDVYKEILGIAFDKAIDLLLPNSPVPFVYEVGTGESWACKE